MKKRITVQKISSKQGTSKAGKVYTKYGINDGEIWYNTFQAPLVEEGAECDIEFEVTQFGNDLKSITPVNVTENKTNATNRQNSIIRQHSQEMALRYFEAKGQKDFDWDALMEITTAFEKDAQETDVPFTN